MIATYRKDKTTYFEYFKYLQEVIAKNKVEVLDRDLYNSVVKSETSVESLDHAIG